MLCFRLFRACLFPPSKALQNFVLMCRFIEKIIPITLLEFALLTRFGKIDKFVIETGR